MKFDSRLFDRIRIAPDPEALERDLYPACAHAGCDMPGTHRAPIGRGHEGEYYHFCLDHVREYNKSYNYFAGMPDGDVAAYQKDALTGHRPTFRMGVEGTGGADDGAGTGFRGGWTAPLHDILGLFPGGWRRRRQPEETQEPAPRRVKPLERRALEALGLHQAATAEEIKARYKELVKRHHPDAHGGNRALEERLRQIIQAYNTLKAGGLC